MWLYSFLWTGCGLVTWDSNAEFSIHVESHSSGSFCFSKNPVFYVSALISIFIVPVIVAGSLYSIVILVIVRKIRNAPVVGVDGLPIEDNTKGAKTLMIVFTCWVVCWMPYSLLILVNHYDPLMVENFHEAHDWLYSFISDILPCVNSCVNPFIYFYRSAYFRHALKDIFLKLQRKSRYRQGSDDNISMFLRMPSVELIVRYSVAAETIRVLPSPVATKM